MLLCITILYLACLLLSLFSSTWKTVGTVDRMPWSSLRAVFRNSVQGCNRNSLKWNGKGRFNIRCDGRRGCFSASYSNVAVISSVYLECRKVFLEVSPAQNPDLVMWLVIVQLDWNPVCAHSLLTTTDELMWKTRLEMITVMIKWNYVYCQSLAY